MSFPQVAEVVHDQTPVRNQVCFILNPVLSSVLSRTDNVVEVDIGVPTLQRLERTQLRTEVFSFV